MTRLPRLSGQETVRALTRAGFQNLRQRGSHVFMQHPDGRTTVIPVHSGETLGPGIISKILRDSRLTTDEFAGLLRL